MKEESTKEEATESKAEESKEQESYDSTAEVPIPEEFQKQVMELIGECDSKECLSFIRDCVYKKEDEIRKAEESKRSKGKKNATPSSFSTADMPA